MCGRFYVPEDDSIQMIRVIVEQLEHRNVKVKTGDVFPGDIAAVILPNEATEDWLNPKYHGNDILKVAMTQMKYQNCETA